MPTVRIEVSYKIWKEFKFAASHQLEGLPADHQCSRLHGHNYLIEVELESEELDATGFVVDFGELSSIKQYIADVLDHRHLNKIFDFNPTAENMAREMFIRWVAWFPQIVAIRVRETDSSWAEYRP